MWDIDILPMTVLSLLSENSGWQAAITQEANASPVTLSNHGLFNRCEKSVRLKDFIWT